MAQESEELKENVWQHRRAAGSAVFDKMSQQIRNNIFELQNGWCFRSAINLPRIFLMDHPIWNHSGGHSGNEVQPSQVEKSSKVPLVSFFFFFFNYYFTFAFRPLFLTHRIRPKTFISYFIHFSPETIPRKWQNLSNHAAN